MSTCDTDRITWIISVSLSNMFARTHQMLCICRRGTRLCSEVRGPQHPKVINTLLCPAYLTPQCHVEMGWMRQEVQRSEALKRETEAKAASEELTSVDRSKPFTTGFINCLVFFFLHIWDVNLPIDELIFFRGVGQPPASQVWNTRWSSDRSMG